MRCLRDLVVRIVALACVAGIVAACDSSTDRDGNDSASSPPEQRAVASAEQNQDTDEHQGCPANGGRVPDRVDTAQVVDVDGDGHRDEVWFSATPTQRVGLATESGTVVATTINTAKPVTGVVVVNADRRGPVEVMVSDGALAHLFVFYRCELVPVIGPDDEPYLFDLGYLGHGTGVLCVDADGDHRRDLVGVNAVDNGDGTYTVSRTVIELDGARATHGHTDESTVEVDPSESNRYYGVRCGPLSLTAEMLVLEPPE